MYLTVELGLTVLLLFCLVVSARYCKSKATQFQGWLSFLRSQRTISYPRGLCQEIEVEKARAEVKAALTRAKDEEQARLKTEEVLTDA
jgi:hypothetical protein